MLKKLLLLTCGLLPSVFCLAQNADELDKKFEKDAKANIKSLIGVPDSIAPWKFGITSALTFNQQQLSDWQAGGSNNLNLAIQSGMFANYRHGRHYWLSLMDASYGINKTEDRAPQKVQDYLEFNTKYGYLLNNYWSVTAFGEGISQFTNGFDYATDPGATKRNSTFMAPGIFSEGFGLVYEYKPKGIYARIAPITARQVFITAPDIDVTRFGIDSGKTALYELGSSIRFDYLKELYNAPNLKITAESRLFMFTSFTKNNGVYVNWRNKLNMNFLKAFTFSLLVHTIYDPNVQFPDRTSTDANGKTVVESTKRKWQLLQAVGFGVGYSFVKKKKTPSPATN
ncbi:MAG: DUF3078 domain-containing protein [Flexibacteraceae bacterium]